MPYFMDIILIFYEYDSIKSTIYSNIEQQYILYFLVTLFSYDSCIKVESIPASTSILLATPVTLWVTQIYVF